MQNLRIPGPTPVPEQVLKAMAKPMINHRGQEFGKLVKDVTNKLKQVLQTKADVYLLTGSGTGGLEAAVANTLSPGDKVLGVSIGVFGDRFLTIAQKFGADVVPLKFEWGKAADADAIRKALQAEPKIKAVLITHNETSTGVTNDLAVISKVVKEFDKLLLVDAISSASSINLPVDEWQCDVAVTASQKGWMVPPGMAVVTVSQAAWKAFASAKMPRFYWDFGLCKKYYEMEPAQTPATPAVSIVFAFDVALDMILKEGIANVFARHARIGEYTRKGIKELGLSIFADEKYASNTVTAVAATNGLDAKKLTSTLRDEYQIILSGGQQTLSGKIFRIGHMGWVNEKDIKAVITALKAVLPKVGFVRG